MANSIVKIEEYLAAIDEVYAMASLTAGLDTPKEWVRSFNGSPTVQIADIDMDSLGDTDRTGELVEGDVDLSWNDYILTQDRNRKFYVDRIDDIETLKLAFGKLSSEFMRRKVVNEIDAYRFASYAGSAGTTVATTLSSAENVLAAINTAQETMFNAEVPLSGCKLYCNYKIYNYLKSSITFERLPDGNGIDREVPFFDSMEVVKVPESRFYSSITLKDGTSSGETGGGYTTGGQLIEFMIVDPSAVAQTVVHDMQRFFAPNKALMAASGADGVVEKRDAWSFDYRIIYDAFVMDNKTDGVYVQTETA